MKKIALLFTCVVLGSILASCSLTNSSQKQQEDAILLDGMMPKEDAKTIQLMSAEMQVKSQ